MDKTKNPTLRFISSWDDGDCFDVKLAALLLKYSLPAIFYIPTHCALSNEEIRKLSQDGFEIGGHTVDHPSDMKLLTDQQIHYQVRANKEFLETTIRKPVTKFCYPRGRYDERVIAALKKYKYKQARTTVVLKTEVEDKYREPTTIHVYQREEYGEHDWYDWAVEMASKASATNGIFHIWGHSWEIQRDENWNKLESLFEYLRENYEIIKEK